MFHRKRENTLDAEDAYLRPARGQAYRRMDVTPTSTPSRSWYLNS